MAIGVPADSRHAGWHIDCLGMSVTVSITITLQEWAGGDPSALDRLTPEIYPELQTLARAYLRQASRREALQTTEVVNELFVRLLTMRPAQLHSRRHFYALSARIIRMALVDNYRRQRAERRGGHRDRVPLHEDLSWVDAAGVEILSFDIALTELEQMDPELSELAGLRFVLGCTAAEAAELTKLSKATVDRKVKLARAWLRRRMSP
jgi:RNA polymerase sigma factor (TIGR02999 family)